MINPYAIYVNCDGAMDYNAENFGGVGFMITFPDLVPLDPIPISKGRYVGGNIEILELEALIQAMKETIDVFKEHDILLRSVSQIIFITDRYGLKEDEKTSAYKIQNWRSNKWKNYEGKPIKNHKLLDELDKTRNKLVKLSHCRINIEFRPRKQNKVADKLAKAGKKEGLITDRLAKKGEKIGRRKFDGSEIKYSKLKQKLELEVNVFKKEPVQQEWEVWAEIINGEFKGHKIKIYVDDLLAGQLQRGNQYIVKIKTVFTHHLHIFRMTKKITKQLNANSLKYPGRLIHNHFFIGSLMSGPLSKMLQVVKDDPDLDLQVRNNYLNIYFKGGNIAKVNSEKSIEFDKYYFYLETKDKPKKEILKNKEIVADLIKSRNKLILKFKNQMYTEYFIEAKKTMNAWFEKHPNPERALQQNIAIHNKNNHDYIILDLEYQVSKQSDFACTHTPVGKTNPLIPRFDIIAINNKGEICVIELKKGLGALKNKSGLKEHWLGYKNSIGKKPESFVEEMKNLLTQKKELGLIDPSVEIKENEPKFMFAYAYDNSSIETQNRLFLEEYSTIEEPISCITIEYNSHLLNNNSELT